MGVTVEPATQGCCEDTGRRLGTQQALCKCQLLGLPQVLVLVQKMGHLSALWWQGGLPAGGGDTASSEGQVGKDNCHHPRAAGEQSHQDGLLCWEHLGRD